MRTRIKICGITRLEDGQAAVLAGADAIGFVFFRDSPRHIVPSQAATIAAQLPPFVTRVGLFVNPTAAEVQQVLAELSLDVLQFQGDETPEFCRQFHRPYIKVLRVKSGVDINAEISRYPEALGILLDTYDPNAFGGTGRSFDWSIIPAKLSKPLILAGGLTIANVAEAIQISRPYAVDVSSGVEASKGIKDHAKIRAFIDEVRSVDRG